MMMRCVSATLMGVMLQSVRPLLHVLIAYDRTSRTPLRHYTTILSYTVTVHSFVLRTILEDTTVS